MNSTSKIKNIYPLTPLQQGMLFHSLKDTGSEAYVEQISFDLTGEVNVSDLEWAINEFIQRHDALRTVFNIANSKQPVQVVLKDRPITLSVEDLSTLTGEALKKKVIAFKHADRAQGFDLIKGPLVRASCLFTGEREAHLVWSFHHTVMDGWCLPLIFKEVFQLYQQRTQGAVAKMADPTPYHHYIRWLQQRDHAGATSYWTNYLADYDQAVQVLPKRAAQSAPYRLTKKSLKLSERHTNALKQLAQRSKSTMNTLMQTAWGLLLQRYNDCDDVVFGGVVSGRPAELAGVEQMIGLFINTIPVRVCARPGERVVDCIARHQQAAVESSAFDFYPLADSQAATPLKQELINHILVFENYPVDESVAALTNGSTLPFRVDQVQIHDQTSYDLNIIVFLGERLNIHFEYNASAFEPEAVDRLQCHLEMLLTQMADNPDSDVQALDLITPDEKSDLLQRFNDTRCEYDAGTTLHARFEAQVAATPDRIAVTDDQSSLTYAQLNERADQLANLLRAKGVCPNQIVALMMPRSTEMMVAVLATLKAGGAYLPIDAGFPEERIRFMLGDSDARLLLTLSSMDVPDVEAIERLNLDQETDVHAGELQPVDELSSGPNDLAYVIYTSGSTGQPKGVMIEHHSVINRLQWMQSAYPLTENDVLLQKTPYTFDVSVWELFWWFFAGARLSLLPPDGEKDPAMLVDRVARHGVTRMHFVPSMLSVFLDYLAARGTVDSLSSLTQVICSGEALMPAQVAAFHTILSGRRLSNLYGPTEATVDVSFFECMADRPTDQPVPIGQPIANHRLYILSRSGRLQPIGVGGELCIAGVGLARGYLNREALTAEKFIDNPLNPGERLYRTGDLARWRADGNIEYLGRIDHQVKVRGYRIELSEIEVWLQQQAEVTEATVLAIKDDRNESTLCAFVTTSEALDVETLKNRLRATLPDYMVPAHIVVMDAMPLTANGKLDRRALMQQPLRFDSRQPFEAPTNEVEETLVGIWQQVLNQDSVSIHDSFFDLGGDSIKAIRLIGLVTKQMQRPLEIQQLYQQPTVKALALLLTGNTEADARNNDLSDIHTELTQWKDKVLTEHLPDHLNEIEDAYPMSDIGRGMISLSLTNAQDAVYHDQFVYQIHFPEFDDQRLKRALAFMVDKHEMLRARFYMEDEPFLAIFREVPILPFESMDLRGAPSSDQEQRIKADLAEDRTWPFKLDQGPGWRMKLYRLEEQRAVLCWIFHHAVMDGWSIASFMTELMQVYDRERRGESIAVPAERLRSGYRDFIADQYRVQRQADITEFWRQELADYKRFPLDAFRDSDPSPKVVSTFLDADVLGRLREVAQRHHLPLKSLCFTAYALALHMFTEDREFVLGLVENNRPSVVDGDKILGCFLNTVPFKVSVPDNASLKNLVEGIHDKVMRMKTFGRLSLVKIVEALNESFYGENPFFDVIFNYVDFHIYEQVGSEYRHERVLDLNSYERTNTYLDVTISTTLNELEIRMTSSLAEAVTQQMADYCTRILQGMADDLEQPYSKATFMTSAERCHLLDEVNDTATDYPKDQPLQQLFEHQVELHADKAALRFGDAELSYGDLNHQANRLAHALQQAGVGPGRVVGLLCDRSFAMVAATLGVLKAGGAYLPIDPEYPQERQSFMLGDSDAQWLLLGDGQTAPEGYIGQTIELASLLDDATLDDTNPTIANRSDDIAYVMYTSGSTGTPKGIRTRHYNASRVVLNTNYIDFQSDDCVLQLFNYVFDGTTLDMYGALLNGATLRLVDREELLDARRLSARLRTGEISVFCITSALFNALVDWDPASLGFVRKVLFGGESVSVPHVRKALHHVSDDTLIHVYGPTESTVFATAHPVREVPDDATTVPIGTPIANTQVYVLDAGLRLQPLGVPGELCISGDGLAEGYLNQPERTAEAFVEHPFRPGERLYRTGDLARWRPDGTLEHLGRIDLQVKIRGHRIELGEIEHRLAHLEGVDDAIVIVQSHGGDKHLCAFVTGRDDLALPELRQQLARQLPDYMVPTHFEQLEAIPVTANGKADRNALAERQGSLQTGIEYVAPRTETEARLIGLWREVLGLTDEASQPIGAYDHFFELGGHSLKATSLAAKIHRAFEVELPLKDLFAYPTVEQQAQRIEAGTGKRFTAIPQAEAKPYYALSSAQKRLYVLSQMEGGALGYNMPAALSLTGPLDTAAFEAAFQALIDRHEALRTSFELVNGEPVQCIHERVGFAIEHHNLPLLEKPGTSLADAALAAFVRPFKLSRAPLLRVGLIRLAEDQHLLLIDLHHLIADGASIETLLQEVVRLYQGDTLSPQRLHYKDYSEWQRQLANSPEWERQKTYWLEQLGGGVPALELPTDYPRPPVKGFEGASVSHSLNADLSRELRDFARQRDVTLYMVLLSAYSLLLAKYSDQHDILIGTPVVNRPHADLETTVGMFANTLVMRTKPKGDSRYTDFLDRIKHTALDAYDHQDYPFEEVVQNLELTRDLSRNPLFDTLFVLQNADFSEVRFGDLVMASHPAAAQVSKFDLTLNALESDRGLELVLEYSTRLFSRNRMTRLLEHYQALLEQLLRNSDQPLDNLTLLTDRERHQLLIEFNATETPYPQDATAHQLFEAQAHRTPQQPALVQGDKRLTYEELNRRADALAHRLRGEGVAHERLVGILADRSVEMVVAILAVWKADGAYLPLDPSYPEARLRYMLEDSGTQLLLTQPHLGRFEDSGINTLDLSDVSLYEDAPTERRASQSTADSLAYVIYTSGSTGQPKGVQLEHRGTANLARAQQQVYGLGTDDRVLQFASFSFDASVYEILMTLTTGATLYLADKEALLPGPNLTETLRSNAISCVTLPPSALLWLDPKALPDLATITVAGEACTEALVEQWGADRRLINAYGPTETTVCATLTQCRVGEGAPSIGRPIANTRVYILGPDQALQPIGVPGELCVASPGLARGYINRPDQTADRFIDNPHQPGERLYRTGDLARWRPDGTLDYLGRIDHQVKIRGYRVEPGEIEQHLAGHPKVKDGVVVVHGDSLEDRTLCAYYTSAEDLPRSEVRRYLADKLPGYLVPAHFVPLDTMPMTSNGKIDRKALPAPQESLASQGEGQAAETDIEQLLVDIWKETLGLQQVGTDDHFFEVGGDSIKAIQVVSRLNQAGYTLEIKDLFQAPRIVDLARHVTANTRTIDQAAVVGDSLLTPIQRWFFERDFTQPQHWNQAVALFSAETIEESALRRALDALTQHHDALRLVFSTEDSRTQRARYRAPEEGEAYQLERWVPEAGLSETELDDWIQHRANALQAGLDLEQGPLVKLGLVPTQAGDHLLVVIHHLVVDGVSWRILMEDLTTAYEQVRAGLEPVLPMKTDSYHRWADELSTFAASATMRDELAYWAERRESMTLRLPYPDGTDLGRVKDGRQVSMELDTTTTQRLLTETRNAFNTDIDDLLLTALARTLAAWLGIERIPVSLEGHGRENILPDMDVSRTVGWFTSLYPVLLDASGTDSNANLIADQIKRNKETLRQVPKKGLGYGLLRYGATGLSDRLPELPDIGFNYHGQVDGADAGQTFALSKQSPGEVLSPDNQRLFALEFNAMVREGRFQLVIGYNHNQFERPVVQRLADEYRRHLNDIIKVCTQRKTTENTPSDMQFKGISLNDLEGLKGHIKKIRNEG